MKLSNIIKIAGIAILVVCATSCETKKQKEAAEKARLEAEAAAKAAAEEAAALAARVFEFTETVTAVKGAEDAVAYTAEEFTEAFNANVKANAYEATTLQFPNVGIRFGYERCDFTAEQKALVEEFAKQYNSSDKTAKILVEAFALDTKDKEYNKEIAIERGIRVKALLAKYDIEPKNIEVVSYCPCKAKKVLGNASKEDTRRAVISIK